MHIYGKYIVHGQASGHDALEKAYTDLQTKCVGNSKNVIFKHNFVRNAMSENMEPGYGAFHCASLLRS